MADFCGQCSMDAFGEDFRELAGLSTEDDTLKGLFAEVICEGCGYTLVDHTGRCVDPECLEKHGVAQP